MALNSENLADLIVTTYREEMRKAFPSVTKSVVVQTIPKADGTIEFLVEDKKGPAEVDENGFRPLALAIAKAVVGHLESSAEAYDLIAGQKWRIV